MDGAGEPQARQHARTVGTERRVDGIPDFSEVDHAVQALDDFLMRHAKDGHIQEDVLAPRQHRLEARTQRQHGRDAPMDGNLAGCRLENAADHA